MRVLPEALGIEMMGAGEQFLYFSALLITFIAVAMLWLAHRIRRGVV
jgi:hypothetical protein